MERGSLPTKQKRACKVKEVLDTIETARGWFDEPRLQDAVGIAGSTLSFLTKRAESIEVEFDDEHRPIDLKVQQKPWWPRDELSRNLDDVLLELRNVRIRQIALSQGLAHFLKTLNAGQVIFEATVDDIDDATNLAALRAHERLMEGHLEGWTFSLNLEALKPLFLLKKGVNGNQLYHRIRCMELLGLWKARPPDGKGGEWRIGIGPIAKIFHFEAYAPAIEELRKDPRLTTKTI